ncbi:MAG: Gfo/Idh/MocA family oxidoreductase [Alphaproteobacteria bacterium]|nr:Gfo/Idh/MocA family oxidoreductase [Alphaproteobacteria bacterium]
MNLLVIGLGSMGKRRIRCLKRLGVERIIAYDPRADRRAEAAAAYGIATFADWAEAAAAPADAWIVSTPPDTHVEYGLRAVARGVSFFCEANVTDPRADQLIERLDASGLVGAPSCTMRYYAGPKRIKALVEAGAIGRPLAFTYQCGQYLPDWHPWESYKDFYVSKRATGACREIVPFELAWIVDLLGPVARLSCLKDKVGDLDCDIDDVYQLLLRFERGAVSGHLMVDVLARPAVRLFRLCGADGTVEWDQAAGRVRLWTAATGAWEAFDLSLGAHVEPGYLHAEEPYVEETADFIAALRGEKPWAYDFREDGRMLALLTRAEASARQGRHL